MHTKTLYCSTAGVSRWYLCLSPTLLASTDSDVGMTTVNHCLDAAKACNVDELCQKLRTEYVSACIKPTAKSGLCNRPKCNKALRRFFDRVPADYTHELLFCPCTDTACAERRRQTIVPSCSYESLEKPHCITQMRICKADYVCRLAQGKTELCNWLPFISMSVFLSCLCQIVKLCLSAMDIIKYIMDITYCYNIIKIPWLVVWKDPLPKSQISKANVSLCPL